MGGVIVPLSTPRAANYYYKFVLFFLLNYNVKSTSIFAMLNKFYTVIFCVNKCKR